MQNFIFHEDNFHDVQPNNVNDEKNIIFSKVNESSEELELSNNVELTVLTFSLYKLNN